MSYCRFSSMGYKCNIYAYQRCDRKYVVHVASYRRFLIPHLLFWPGFISKLPRWLILKIWRLNIHLLGLAPRVKIRKKYAGETREFEDIESFEGFLRELKGLGYKFPDSVFWQIENEKRCIKEVKK